MSDGAHMHLRCRSCCMSYISKFTVSCLALYQEVNLIGGVITCTCVCVYAKISRVYRVVFFNRWMKSFYLWKMYTDISVSIKCDICNQSQKNMNIWRCIHKCLLHSWRYNYSNSSSTPFDTNVIRDCVILLSQRCHLNILTPIGTLSQRRRRKRKK